MNVMIHGSDIKVNGTLEEFTKKKVEKLDRFLPNIREVRVDFSRQHTKRGEDLTVAQITLQHSRGAILRSEEKLPGADQEVAQAAVTSAVNKMYRRIERFKGKRSRKGRERYMATDEELSIAEETPEYEALAEEYADYDDIIEIVRRKEVQLDAMAETEAIEQMELLGHTFFMFLNAKTNEINVLYRRSSDGYGILVPTSSS